MKRPMTQRPETGQCARIIIPRKSEIIPDKKGQNQEFIESFKRNPQKIFKIP